jgi:predicted HAD superfamily Cof-like phosphohydrolase
MNSSYETPFMQVKHFHKDVLQSPPPSKPELPGPGLENERMTYILEEMQELQMAFINKDLVGAADAIADLLYVTYGTAVVMGLPMDDIWRVVHQANMRKRAGMTKRGFTVDAVKPEGWIDPKAAIREMLK